MAPRLPSATTAVALDAALRTPLRPAAAAASFSSSARLDKTTQQRWEMHQWLNGFGNELLEGGRASGASYLGPFTDQPFPNNPLFRSQSVLSDEMRNIIHRKVMVEGNPMKSVSEEMGVDVRRVAAVVRLKEVEKQWAKDGKKLATPYAKAVMDMLPQTRWFEGEKNKPHEPINDIPVHKLSVQQLFVPVSESRHFTREDAAKAFHERLLSADARSPHQQLIRMERELAADTTTTTMTTTKADDKLEAREKALAKFREAARDEEEKYAKQLADKHAKEEKAIKRVDTGRYEFRVKEVNADNVGRDGKSRRGVGWRYGAPLPDRKRGMVKIPTSVP